MSNSQTITLAGGCFWCLEAVFRQIKGVRRAVSGYIGGHVADPDYKGVCTGTTGHAEAVQLTFDPRLISLQELLEVFFSSHDPTTRNRQGNDIGTQYRSAIFYHSAEQKQIARQFIAGLDAAHFWPNSVVTEIMPAGTFYPAEGYHQDYFANNAHQSYCQLVVAPKVTKVRQYFSEKVISAD
ncbi:MAG TPA: peptide-methionine (S)-S-oxide reductase MsrA [Methylophilaceae bacterium]|nr:peptide-methionine (S)-S-oxide reductase MsrA [Methylophilaceae bacterium]HQR60389.1 peptide-methionine (S)-S-oxide reductase MsrA [Methylophilaceae bacterium]